MLNLFSVGRRGVGWVARVDQSFVIAKLDGLFFPCCAISFFRYWIIWSAGIEKRDEKIDWIARNAGKSANHSKTHGDGMWEDRFFGEGTSFSGRV
jgi:hypothetical protein